ncbi:flavodoxin family protein [Methylobacterium sp. JK268]
MGNPGNGQAGGTVGVTIVYHSGYGHTKRQAEAVAEGVRQVGGARALLLPVEDAQQRWDDLHSADAIIFGAPTYMGSASAPFKAFQDATSHWVMARGYLWRDKLAAGFTNSGAQAGDKLSTLLQMVLFAAQHGMHWINLDLPPANNATSGSPADLNRLGFWIGAAAQSNTDEGPDKAPPEADLATARHLGRRVARIARQLARGRDESER